MTYLKRVQIGALIAGEQPNAGDLLELRKQGVRSVVNLRPTEEVSDGPTPEQEGGLASVLGLAFEHLPVSAEHLSEADVHAFKDSLAELPAPVYVHCGRGQRAVALSLLAEGDASTSSPAAIAKAERLGIILSPRVRDLIEDYFEQRQVARRQDEAIFALIVR